MFTGLVEEIGTIKEYKSIPDGKEAWIEGHIVIDCLLYTSDAADE